MKTRFGNHLELEVWQCKGSSYGFCKYSLLHLFLQVKPTEVDPIDLDNLCRIIRGKLFDIPLPRSLLNDLEVCIGGMDSITAENATVAEISLSKEMIMTVGHWLGNEERTMTLLSEVHLSDRVVQEQLSDQLFRDGIVFLR